ncbi:hypothetical protein LTR27_003930 [Elasticomyces elasticus]|nr:hypothetical protein LTR27_003930 [Elasticomyces elasticus]
MDSSDRAWEISGLCVREFDALDLELSVSESSVDAPVMTLEMAKRWLQMHEAERPTEAQESLAPLRAWNSTGKWA